MQDMVCIMSIFDILQINITFIQSQEGQTPLLIAMRKGNVVLARELLEAGANPNYMDMVSPVTSLGIPPVLC